MTPDEQRELQLKATGGSSLKIREAGEEAEFEWYDQEDKQTHVLYLTKDELNQALSLMKKRTTQADVCLKCNHMKHCDDNCEAYMVIARLSINLDDYVHALDTHTKTDKDLSFFDQGTPRDYLAALADDLREMAVI